MKKYLVKIPWPVKKVWRKYVWNIPVKEKILFLTFDDGPHHEATSYVLDELKKWKAKATFFCIGKNVMAEPEVYERITAEGHIVGNHSHNHLNGWQAHSNVYLNDISEAALHIESNLYRPPYGRIKPAQARQVPKAMGRPDARIIMWSVLSGDFDPSISPEQCLYNVLLHAKPGSIIVFHDSKKSFEALEYALPRVLEHFSKKGYRFEALNDEVLKIRKKKAWNRLKEMW